MKISKVIAIASITTAFASIFLVIGAFFINLSYSCIFLAAVAILFPLSKNTIKGGVLSVIASGLLSFFIASFSFETSLPFVLFFGFHPIVSKIFRQKNMNKALAFIIKDLWFIAAMVVCYFFTEMFVTDNETLKKIMIYIIIFGGTPVFAAYDYMFYYFQQKVDLIVAKLKI